MRQVRETLTNILYHDDTNIDLEKQIAEITKNQFLHNFALTVMTDQIDACCKPRSANECSAIQVGQGFQP